MSVTCQRQVVVQFTGDVNLPITATAAPNTSSPGSEIQTALSSGDNVIPVPTGSKSITILKPTGNTVLLKLKRQTSDAGLELDLLDVDSLSLNAACVQIVLNAAAGVSVRLVWG